MQQGVQDLVVGNRDWNVIEKKTKTNNDNIPDRILLYSNRQKMAQKSITLITQYKHYCEQFFSIKMISTIKGFEFLNYN